MEQEKFLCVMAGYDPATEAVIAARYDQVQAAGFTGTQTPDIPFHITLGTFPVSEEAYARRLVEQVAAETPAFPVAFNHLGVFQGGKVLFLAPDANHQLLALRERFGPVRGWTAHTTLLIDQPAEICRALPAALEGFTAFEGRIERLWLYEFFPARYLDSQSLR